MVLSFPTGRCLAPFMRGRVTARRTVEDGITEFYECGPQKQLKAMMKRIDNKMWNKTTSVEV